MSGVKRKEAEKVFVESSKWARIHTLLPYGSIQSIADNTGIDAGLVRKELITINKKGLYRKDVFEGVKEHVRVQKIALNELNLVLEG